jgi:Type III restriction enzyme, res subunit/Helicase C-terminal domain
MVDFDKFGEGVDAVDPRDPVALYYSLDRKQSHVDLRPPQKELLEAWALRRDERDVVLKLATGAGKTTIGLIALYSHMLETKRPVLFLCPTNQLVEQVTDEAARCGIPCVSITGGSEIPPEALGGQAILATSVQNVFHARAGHFTKAKFYAIVVDDAHSAVEIVRQQFRLSIVRKDPVYAKLLGIFLPALKSQSLGTAQEIQDGVPSGGLEVPYWVWAEQREVVTKLIAERVQQDDELFKSGGDSHGFALTWGMIKNVLHGTRCVFASSHLEFAPEIPPLTKVPTFLRAERRVFMSATIADESVLVRELGCEPEAAAHPIEIPNAGGIGERMVLVPRLMAKSAKTAIAWADLAELCKRLATKYAVVVLTPSMTAAKQWRPIGADVIEDTNRVPAAMKKLRQDKAGFVVFANRYDGLDLPDDACRVLVLDGAPKAQSLIDGVDMLCEGATVTRQRAVMHRIEQGLGRAVRSPADYAVVILFGNDIVTNIAMTETRAELTDQTRRQIEFGLEIAGQVKKSGDWRGDVEELTEQCLQRDPSWLRAYKNKGAVRASQPGDATKRTARIALANAERSAWEKFVNGQGAEAAEVIQRYLNVVRPPDNEKAFLMQRAAWYVRREDPARSLEMQKFARENDAQLLMPPSRVVYRKHTRRATGAAAHCIGWLSKFSHPNAAIAAIDDLRTRLVFSPHASWDAFEAALRELGEALGFDSSRPERAWHVGSDVLWIDGPYVVPIEVKNNISADTKAISKDDAGQLTQSTSWAAEAYADRPKHVPMIAHPVTKVGEAAFPPPKTRVLTPKHLTDILDAFINVVGRGLYVGNEVASADVADRLLEDAELTLQAILEARTSAPK